jgi:carboxyl-terminal processing protease
MKQLFINLFFHLKIKIAVLIIITGTLTTLTVQAQLSEKSHYDISKYLDIYNSLFKELNLFYVDSIDVKKTIQDNISFMLRRLDPYTEYIPEENMQEFELQTTGEYGGVGALIGTSKEGNTVVSEPYEGMPAALAGLQPGDTLLEIDNINLEGKDSKFVSEHLRGQSDTKVKVKFRHPGESKPKEIVIERKHLQINPVTYYGVLQGNTGYIYLSEFTTHSASDLKAAFDDLKTKGITSLIIDVRDNGGGVVENCLEILNYFIPKGELLLTMKGKFRQLDRTFRATQQPIAPDIPLVVLVNRSSASASEILSGTLQDLDRAVIIGTRTYGKGLVQSPRQLPYNGELKVTTAKYYIPSGRNIQAIDYSHRNEDGSASYIPDSLTSVFHTSKGRPVRDGGGINPDFITEEKKLPTISYYLDRDNLFFDFVVEWRTKHPQIALPEQFVLSDDIYNAFKAFVQSKKFDYDRQSGEALKNLKEIMNFEGYLPAASEEFKALENKLKPDLNRDLDYHKDALSNMLAGEIMKQYYYKKGVIIYSLRDDNDLKKALEVLSDKNLYEKTLSGK